MQSAHTTPRHAPRSHNPDALAARLHDLADEIARGERRRAGRGAGGLRQLGMPVVPLAIHDALCGWRIATEQTPDAPGLLACAGCGMAYDLAEIHQLDDEQPRRAE